MTMTYIITTKVKMEWGRGNDYTTEETAIYSYYENEQDFCQATLTYYYDFNYAYENYLMLIERQKTNPTTHSSGRDLFWRDDAYVTINPEDIIIVELQESEDPFEHTFHNFEQYEKDKTEFLRLLRPMKIKKHLDL